MQILVSPLYRFSSKIPWYNAHSLTLKSTVHTNTRKRMQQRATRKLLFNKHLSCALLFVLIWSPVANVPGKIKSGATSF